MEGLGPCETGMVGMQNQNTPSSIMSGKQIQGCQTKQGRKESKLFEPKPLQL